MSRSEHATRRDPKDHGDLDRKRRVKALIASERLRPRLPELAVTGDAVRIEVRDHGPFIHYPASAEDLRALIGRLPPGCVNGIATIELCLMAAERDPDPDPERMDPYVGRLARELAPGVFAGRVLGCYFPEGARIQVFGYAYDPAVRDRSIIEIYLRLKMLATFVHELGHHQDSSMRVARGRWRADDTEECEVHAEALQHVWTRDHVVPYLEDRYPAETDELRRWLEYHGGIALPLDALVGDPRTTRARDAERLLFTVDGAFEALLDAVARGEPRRSTQLQLATDLHYGRHYDEAHAILTQILAEDPAHAGALGLRADIFVHEDRFAEAEVIARHLVTRDATDEQAWQVLRDIAQARGDWAGVLEAACRMDEAATEDTRSRLNLELRTRARIELADWPAAERDVAALQADAAGPWSQRLASAVACLLLLRQQRFAEAHALATSLRSVARTSPDVLAVQFEAARQLGRPCDIDWGPELSDALRRRGYAVWADRLDVLATAAG